MSPKHLPRLALNIETSTGPERIWLRQTILDFNDSLVNRVHIAIIHIASYVYTTRATGTFCGNFAVQIA